MQTIFSGKNRWLYHIATLAIIAGFILTTMSWLHICTEECAKSHSYHLFGLPFEYFGYAFFTTLLISHFFSQNSAQLRFLSILLVATGLGAEVMFILIQKYKIGTWCPVCLGIATCVALCALAYGISYVQEFHHTLNNTYKGDFMKSSWRGIASLTAFAVGFLMAFMGITHTTQLQAAQSNIRNQLWIGNAKSPVEVYIFTDWACPACRKIEPLFEEIGPEMTDKANVLFVDFAIHPATFNYSPYNVSFLVNNKEDYFKIRKALTQLSIETGEPTKEAIDVLAHKVGVKYKDLNFADITLANKYFKDLGKQFDIDATPTMVIVNPATKKGKKLAGQAEITRDNVFKYIDEMKKAE